MKSKSDVGLYFLLVFLAAIGMAYYVAGALALDEEFFHASRYAREPFDFGDNGQALKRLEPESKGAGLADGDLVLAVNGLPFTGYVQIHKVFQRTHPGDAVERSARTPAGSIRAVRLVLSARHGPGFSFDVFVGLLMPILGVPLLGLLVGYWVAAARIRDVNAWLVFVLLAFPETAFGNLDWQFWPGYCESFGSAPIVNECLNLAVS